MNIVVDIGHPAQAHFFKNFIFQMKDKGHDVLVTTVDKDVAVDLLKELNINHINLGSTGKTFIRKVLSIPVLNIKLYNAVKNFSADLFLGFGSIRAAQVAKFMRKPCVMFNDTEATMREHILYLPFVDYVVTPKFFRRDFGKKHVRIDTFAELSYLNQKYFSPNEEILKKIGVEKNEPYFVLRFVAWQATHDLGQSGFNLEQKIKILEALKKKGKVFITSEDELESELKAYQLKCDVKDFHHVLYYAQMLVAESHKVSTEAALLGTPVIRYNSYVGDDDMGNFPELENVYGLLYSYNDFEKAYEKMNQLLDSYDNIKEEWQKRRERLMTEKVDVTQWMVEFVEEKFQK